MTAPTLYRLIFKRNDINEYDVYEQHRCQEKGCFWTDEEYTGNTCIPGKVEEFIKEYQDNLLEGIIDEVEIKYIEVEQ
jgi:hypothetical protein